MNESLKRNMSLQEKVQHGLVPKDIVGDLDGIEDEAWSEVDRLEDQVAEMDTEINELEDKNSSLLGKIDDLEDEIKDLKSQIDTLEGQLYDA